MGSSAIDAGSPSPAMRRITLGLPPGPPRHHRPESLPVAVVAVGVQEEMKAAGPLRQVAAGRWRAVAR